MFWRPILEGDDKARAEEALADIARSLAGPVVLTPGLEHSLARGAAGIATFHAYRGSERSAARWLSAAVEGVGRRGVNGSLYAGVTGIAWALGHLHGEPTEDIDRWLRGHVCTQAAPGDHDLMSGLTGYAVYALERLPDRVARRCLEEIVARLHELAVPDRGGVTWPTADGYVNLGLAHGVPAVVAVLAACCAAGVAEDRARPLLASAVRWLLAQRLPSGTFPGRIGPGEEPEPGRSAWCYGDPGVATALLIAGRCAGEPAWEHEAVMLARGVARRPPEESGVEDAGLCHGAAGLAHLLNRLYQATGDRELLDAARHWFSRALDLRTPGSGVAGFSALRYDAGARGYQDPDPGVLMGAAGIGLALLAATTDVEPAWDRIFLLSVAGA